MVRSLLLSVVRRDLEKLSKICSSDTDEENLRDETVRLRRLLIDDCKGNLLRAWTATGFPAEPTIIAPSLEQLRKICPSEMLYYVKAGGASQNGLTFGSMMIFNKTDNPKLQELAIKVQRITNKEFTVSEFINSACMIINGAPFSRKELIRYVGYKLGGIHYDEKREWILHEELDKLREFLFITDKDAIYHELLSLIQHLMNSPDIKKFQQKLEEMH